MARTTSDLCGYRSTFTTNQLRHTSHQGISRKRDFHQLDLGSSYSFPSSPAPWPSPANTNAAQPSRVDNVQVYEPGDYCAKLANEAGAMHFAAAKRQRVESFDESQPLARSATYAPNMRVPSAPEVATSMSAPLSPPCSLTSSETMSRHSSVSSASVTDAFDMMRVESSFSTASDLYPLDPIDGSFVSCVTEKPASRQSTTGLNNGSASHSLDAAGYVSTNQFSFHSHNLPAAVGGQQNSRKSGDEGLHPEDEDISNNTPVELKASERRRKHIENSRKSIAPRTASEVRKPVSVPNMATQTYGGNIHSAGLCLRRGSDIELQKEPCQQSDRRHHSFQPERGHCKGRLCSPATPEAVL